MDFCEPEITVGLRELSSPSLTFFLHSLWQCVGLPFLCFTTFISLLHQSLEVPRELHLYARIDFGCQSVTTLSYPITVSHGWSGAVNVQGPRVMGRIRTDFVKFLKKARSQSGQIFFFFLKQPSPPIRTEIIFQYKPRFTRSGQISWGVAVRAYDLMVQAQMWIFFYFF